MIIIFRGLFYKFFLAFLGIFARFFRIDFCIVIINNYSKNQFYLRKVKKTGGGKKCSKILKSGNKKGKRCIYYIFINLFLNKLIK